MLSLGLREEAEREVSPAATPRLLAAPSPGPHARGAPPAAPNPPQACLQTGPGKPHRVTASPLRLPSAFSGHRRQMVATAGGQPRGTGHRAEALAHLLLSLQGPGLSGSTTAPQSLSPGSSLPAPSPRCAPATRFFSSGNLGGQRLGAGWCFSRLAKPRVTYFSTLLVLNVGESLCNQRSLPAGPGEAESSRCQGQGPGARGRGHRAGSALLGAVCRGHGLGELRNPSGEPGASKASCPAPGDAACS